MSHETLARAVRRAHIAYSDELIAAIRARVPVETLLSWGIPWADIDQVLYRKGRTHGPTSRCSCGHAEERHDDMYTAGALEGPRTCREVGCLCRTFVEYVKSVRPDAGFAAPPCRDVFPPHRNPPPGPPAPPRTCSLAWGHSGEHGRDGVTWPTSAKGSCSASETRD